MNKVDKKIIKGIIDQSIAQVEDEKDLLFHHSDEQYEVDLNSYDDPVPVYENVEADQNTIQITNIPIQSSNAHVNPTLMNELNSESIKSTLDSARNPMHIRKKYTQSFKNMSNLENSDNKM